MTTTVHDVAPETLHNVRREVRHILENSPSYWELPQQARQEMANAMVRVGAYLVDGERPAARAGAQALDDPHTPPTPPSVDFDPGKASSDFTDDATRKGTTDFAAEVKAVNF